MLQAKVLRAESVQSDHFNIISIYAKRTFWFDMSNRYVNIHCYNNKEKK